MKPNNSLSSKLIYMIQGFFVGVLLAVSIAVIACLSMTYIIDKRIKEMKDEDFGFDEQDIY